MVAFDRKMDGRSAHVEFAKDWFFYVWLEISWVQTKKIIHFLLRFFHFFTMGFCEWDLIGWEKRIYVYVSLCVYMFVWEWE